ncbi:hypothetical protein MOF8_22850 [Methylobacterium oryzae]
MTRRDDPGRGESVTDILRRAGRSRIEGRGKAGADPAAQASYAMHAHGAVFAEVKVDPDLGQIRVSRLVGAFAAGRVINPRLVQSQYYGGMIWGLSFARRVSRAGERRRARPGGDPGPRGRRGGEQSRREGGRRDRHHRHGGRHRQRGLARHRRAGPRDADHPRQAARLIGPRSRPGRVASPGIF